MAVSNINTIDCELYCFDMFFVMTVHFHGSVLDLKGKTVLDFGGFFPTWFDGGVNFLALFFKRRERG